MRLLMATACGVPMTASSVFLIRAASASTGATADPASAVGEECTVIQSKRLSLARGKTLRALQAGVVASRLIEADMGFDQ